MLTRPRGGCGRRSVRRFKAFRVAGRWMAPASRSAGSEDARNLPSLPIAEFKEKNALSDQSLRESRFDQELFGVQQAIAGRGLVFASETLCSALIRDNLLVESGFLPVDSRLGFYLNEGAENKGLAALKFVGWIKSVIRPNDR